VCSEEGFSVHASSCAFGRSRTCCACGDPRVGAATWVLGSVLLALLAGIAAVLAATFVYFLVG
jgi:hypothetical protein